jgi:hypothetical protein
MLCSVFFLFLFLFFFAISLILYFKYNMYHVLYINHCILYNVVDFVALSTRADPEIREIELKSTIDFRFQ